MQCWQNASLDSDVSRSAPAGLRFAGAALGFAAPAAAAFAGAAFAAGFGATAACLLAAGLAAALACSGNVNVNVRAQPKQMSAAVSVA